MWKGALKNCRHPLFVSDLLSSLYLDNECGMALPKLPNFSLPVRKKTQTVAIDLGLRSTKAVFLQRKGDVLQFSDYAVVHAPQYTEGFLTDTLADHLKEVAQSLVSRIKTLTVAPGLDEVFIKPAELPSIPVKDLRTMLKYNSKVHLQQELKGYTFDCHILPRAEGQDAVGKKSRVLVAAAKEEFVNNIFDACKSAGFHLDCVFPSLLGPINAFEKSMPEVFNSDVVALVDLGYKSSTILLLNRGEMSMSRTVTIGGQQITRELADTMQCPEEEAESLKIGMMEEVQTFLYPLLSPLGRELRASVDYFEHSNDTTVSKVYFTGAAAASSYFIETLQTELMIPCEAWNPVNGLEHNLPPEKMGDIEAVGPQLSVAVGAALGGF